MKKYVLATIVTLMSISLTACGGGSDSKVISGDVNTTVSNEETQVSENVETADSSVEAEGYVFSYNGTDVVMDADSTPILAGLGDPTSYYEAASCAFNGLDKMYTYNSFELDTYPSADKDLVSTVILKDDAVSTKEGICIGDTEEKMLSVYGSDYTDEDGMIVFRKANMKLCFIVNDGTIASIKYMSTVLDAD